LTAPRAPLILFNDGSTSRSPTVRELLLCSDTVPPRIVQALVFASHFVLKHLVFIPLTENPEINVRDL
jgi:hypothetical protein